MPAHRIVVFTFVSAVLFSKHRFTEMGPLFEIARTINCRDYFAWRHTRTQLKQSASFDIREFGPLLFYGARLRGLHDDLLKELSLRLTLCHLEKKRKLSKREHRHRR